MVCERSVPANASLRWLIRDVTERKRLEKERARWLVAKAKAKAARRFEFLAAASSLLVESLDVEASLIALSSLTASFLKGWCFINVVDPGGSLRQLEVAHADTSLAELAKELRGHCLFGGMTEADCSQVLAGSGGDRTVDRRMVRPSGRQPIHAACCASLLGGRAMILPILIRGRIVGALRSFRPGRAATSRADQSLGEDLARRCALALEMPGYIGRWLPSAIKATRTSRAEDEFVAIPGARTEKPRFTPVLGWARILSKHPVIAQDPTLAEGVRAMKKNAMAITRLVGECVDLTKISEKGKIRIERTPVDLNQIVEASAKSIREMAAERGLRVAIELAPEPARVMGDAMRLEQVVMNLLVNAVKYTGNGGLISIRTAAMGEETEVEVYDTGIRGGY